jgi:alpha/beta superfamily hydrolase
VTTEIRGAVELPARRESVELQTSDGLTLVGELSLPLTAEPVATMVALHPLPTHGGFMDSHIIKKAALRLPALADIAVLRFNFRGVTSPHGTSQGEFGHGIDEQHDLSAAMDFVAQRGLPHPWVVGWSFGTEVALKFGRAHDLDGMILLSPPLHRTSPEEIAAWADSHVELGDEGDELDDFLRPAEAAQRFATAPNIELVNLEGGKHLWVGETQTYRVLSEIVQRLNPAALPLPAVWP